VAGPRLGAEQRVAGVSGRTLLHLSAQRKPLCVDIGCWQVILTKTAQVHLRSGRVAGAYNRPLFGTTSYTFCGIKWVASLVSDEASQVEVRSGVVYGPASVAREPAGLDGDAVRGGGVSRRHRALRPVAAAAAQPALLVTAIARALRHRARCAACCWPRHAPRSLLCHRVYYGCVRGEQAASTKKRWRVREHRGSLTGQHRSLDWVL